MMLSFILFTFLISILAFFSEEFIAIFMRINAIPGMSLILPMTVASVLVIEFEVFIFWTMAHLQHMLMQFSYFLSEYLWFLPFHRLWIFVCFSAFCSIIPFLVWDYYYQKKHRRTYRHRYPLICILWILFVILMLLPPLY